MVGVIISAISTVGSSTLKNTSPPLHSFFYVCLNMNMRTKRAIQFFLVCIKNKKHWWYTVIYKLERKMWVIFERNILTLLLLHYKMYIPTLNIKKSENPSLLPRIFWNPKGKGFCCLPINLVKEGDSVFIINTKKGSKLLKVI